jgi:riboflavin kinase/FMN adenylyltransferase
VYACKVGINAEHFNAVVNVGVRPTFGETLDKPIIEAHVLDYSGDLYGQELELIFIDRLRDERRFNGPEELLVQIQRDIERAKLILSQT